MSDANGQNPLFDQALEAQLIQLAERRAAEYGAAKPFPHAVFEDFLPEPVLSRALDAFPAAGRVAWEKFYSENEKKLAFFAAERLPPPIRDVLYFLNSPVMLRFLEKLTGIEGLLPDPYFYGGGLHQLERGGFLRIHADFNRLERLSLNRRLNLLLYLNKDWQESYGGNLELWDTGMTRCERKVVPVFNRCVVFTTTSDAYHGNPEPIACPEGMSRRSIAIYYYTALKPGEAAAPIHSTLFQTETSRGLPQNSGFKESVKRWVPPALLDVVRGLRGK